MGNKNSSCCFVCAFLKNYTQQNIDLNWAMYMYRPLNFSGSAIVRLINIHKYTYEYH